MNLADLTLLRPWWLLALAPLAALLWRLWRAPDPGELAWRRQIDAHLLPHLLVFAYRRRRRSTLALCAAALLAAVLALAGPATRQPQASYQRDLTRLLIVDLSPAMSGQLEAVKLKLLALLQALPDGQTALLVYGGEPYLVVPPTPDAQTIALFVPELASEAIPVPGNRPERALRMAAQVLARSGSRQREIVWVTAGSAGTDLPLAELAGVRLSILHAGLTDQPALLAAASRSGGALVRLRADDGDLRQLLGTLASGGAWISARGTAKADAVEFGYWLLLPLLPLAALAFRRGILALLLAPLWLGGLLTPQPAYALEPLAALRADYQGWRLLQAGQPQAAAERFADPRWRAAAHYRAGQFEQAARLLAGVPGAAAHYNRGNALAQQGQLSAALAAFEAALALRPDDADTLHNRDLVRRLLQQQSDPPPAGTGSAPPPPAPSPAPGQASAAEREADRVAEQWLRGIPDQPGSLLQRKLRAEQRRRQASPAGEAARPW